MADELVGIVLFFGLFTIIGMVIVFRARTRRDQQETIRLAIEIPQEYARYVAKKGSVCVDGVSLTINEVSGNRFELNIIPHTAEVTTIGDYAVGTTVNIEVDLLARYLERQIAGLAEGDGVSLEFLKDHGYA